MLNPKQTVAELKAVRELTADENGAQRVAFTETWRCALAAGEA
jgi:beta-ureidopropionase / N-carbamoyl-L-amino-acid hydrolase